MSEKLDNPNTLSKLYQTIVNNFLNNIKIPNIPPCKLMRIKNSCKLTVLKQKTGQHLNYFEGDAEDIYGITKNLHPHKVHGWDNNSIRTIQLWQINYSFFDT